MAVITSRLGHRRWKPYSIALLGPSVLFVIAMMALPVGYTLFLSVHRWAGGLNDAPAFVGLDNYVAIIFDDPRFRAALVNTFLFAGTGVALQTVLGVGIALQLGRSFRGRSVVRTLMLFPMVATPVAVALIWRLLFQPDGLINQMLGTIGIRPAEWLSSPVLALVSLVIADTWQWTPLIAIIVLAGLMSLPRWPFEAAAVDGANRAQIFRFVTLPLLLPTIVVAVTLRAIDALKTFDLIVVLTGGGPGFATETVNLYAYRITFQYQQLGYSGALLITFLVVIGAITAILLSFRRRVELS